MKAAAFIIFFALHVPYSSALSSSLSSQPHAHHQISKNQDTSSQHQQKRQNNKNANTKWIACSSTKEVSRAIDTYINHGDIVAELGSQLRESSTRLCEAIGPAGKAVLVDIERKFPNEKKDNKRTTAMRRKGDGENFYGDRATFIEIPSFDLWRNALFFQNNHNTSKPQYNAMVVDMSTVAGNDLDLTCISLVKEFISLNYDISSNQQLCRVVIVKSGSLQNLARRLFHAQRVVSGAQSLSTNRMRSGHSSIIGAVGVKQYRETIPYVVREGDVCMEVGCHLGTTTAIIDKAAKQGKKSSSGGCLGVDLGSSIIASAKKKYSHLPFEVGDGFKVGQLARMRTRHFHTDMTNRPTSTYDVVYVDIGGLSGSEGLLESLSLLASISNSLEPRFIVIKSLCIRRLASSLVPFSEVWHNIQRLPD